jgi:hypothetical protein
MKSSRAYALMAVLVLLPAAGCSGVGPRNDDEARDIQELAAHEYNLPPLESIHLDNMKKTNLPLEQVIIDDMNFARKRGNVSYDQVMASPLHQYDFFPINLSGYIVGIRPRNYGGAQGVEAYVSVDGPEDFQDQASGRRYVLAFSPNSSAAHDGDRCVIVGSVGSSNLKLNNHPVLAVCARAILTPAEAARYAGVDDSDITLEPGQVPPSVLATDDPLRQMIQDSGGASLDALVANAQQALQTGDSGEKLSASQGRYKDPVYFSGYSLGTRKVDSDFGTMYLSLIPIHSHEGYEGTAWVFCATQTNAGKYDQVRVIGYVGETRQDATITTKPPAFIIARAVLDEDEGVPLVARLPSADESTKSK